ncbi:putative Sulfotransferase 1C4 [Hypsibius exemplaris]|uniref:Sulfotransferase 1C4 n=1 Tax=Hypsibius exemplaris TaxID=2072580 RepID=A0A1W0XFE6_HYPEX|nr:putative Sulfotransferase 1C4 [Hypsibius exemplaris]
MTDPLANGNGSDEKQNTPNGGANGGARKREGPFASPMKWYRGCQLIQRNFENMPDLEKFEAFDDDVIVATFPKSGTTWMQAIVTLILNNGNPECMTNGLLEEKWPYLESGKRNQTGRHLDAAINMPRPRTLKTHLPWQALPDTADKAGTKIIYVARNPKDTIVSMYYFMKSHRVLDYRGDFEEFVRLFLRNEVLYCPYFDNIASYYSRRNQPNILFTTYESLHNDPILEVRKVADFLGRPVTETEAQQIVQYTTFDEMKNNEFVNYSQTHRNGIIDFNIAPFFRAGKIGTWKQHFTCEFHTTAVVMTDIHDDSFEDGIAVDYAGPSESVSDDVEEEESVGLIIDSTEHHVHLEKDTTAEVLIGEPVSPLKINQDSIGSEISSQSPEVTSNQVDSSGKGSANKDARYNDDEPYLEIMVSDLEFEDVGEIDGAARRRGGTDFTTESSSSSKPSTRAKGAAASSSSSSVASKRDSGNNNQDRDKKSSSSSNGGSSSGPRRSERTRGGGSSRSNSNNNNGGSSDNQVTTSVEEKQAGKYSSSSSGQKRDSTKSTSATTTSSSATHSKSRSKDAPSSSSTSASKGSTTARNTEKADGSSPIKSEERELVVDAPTATASKSDVAAPKSAVESGAGMTDEVSLDEEEHEEEQEKRQNDVKAESPEIEAPPTGAVNPESTTKSEASAGDAGGYAVAIRNLAEKTTANVLKEKLGVVAPVLSCTIFLRNVVERYAVVKFRTLEDCQACVTTFNNADLDGNIISVAVKPRRPVATPTKPQADAADEKKRRTGTDSKTTSDGKRIVRTTKAGSRKEDAGKNGDSKADQSGRSRPLKLRSPIRPPARSPNREPANGDRSRRNARASSPARLSRPKRDVEAERQREEFEERRRVLEWKRSQQERMRREEDLMRRKTEVENLRLDRERARLKLERERLEAERLQLERQKLRDREQLDRDRKRREDEERRAREKEREAERDRTRRAGEKRSLREEREFDRGTKRHRSIEASSRGRSPDRGRGDSRRDGGRSNGGVVVGYDRQRGSSPRRRAPSPARRVSPIRKFREPEPYSGGSNRGGDQPTFSHNRRSPDHERSGADAARRFQEFRSNDRTVEFGSRRQDGVREHWAGSSGVSGGYSSGAVSTSIGPTAWNAPISSTVNAPYAPGVGSNFVTGLGAGNGNNYLERYNSTNPGGVRGGRY